MKLNKVLIYLAILVAVAGYVYFVEIRQKAKTEAAKDKAEQLIELDKDKVTQILLKSPEHGTIDLKKPTDKWVMTLPVKTKADGNAAKDLIFAATTAKREKILKEKDVDWKEFGLDKPGFQITLTSKEKSSTISFGAPNPAKSSYYVRVDDSPRLLLVADTLKNSLNKTVFSLREKSVLAMAPEDVDLVSYSTKGEAIEIKRDDKGLWFIQKPEKLRAKTSVVSRDLNTLTNLTAKNIIDKPKKEGDPYGLENPEKTIRLAGKKLEQTLLIGKTASEEDKGTGTTSDRYARVKGFDTVYVIGDATLKKLKTARKDLEDRSMLAYDVGEIGKMSITLNGSEYQAVKGKDDKWSLEKPFKKDDVEAWNITSILWDIKDLQWKSFKKESIGDLAAYHLDKPKLVISLLKKGEKEPITLKAGWKQDVPESTQKLETKPSDKQKPRQSSPPEIPNPGDEETPLYPHKLKPDLQITDPDAPLPGESKQKPVKSEPKKEPAEPGSDKKPDQVESQQDKESADAAVKPKIPREVFALAEPHDYKGAVFTLEGISLQALIDDLKKLEAGEKKEKE